MDSRTLLIFNLGGALFGVDAARVLETVWLPELTLAEEAPPWVSGLFSLRGRIVPVADLRLRFGHPARPYAISDQVVVLEADNGPMGLIVDEVVEVVELPSEAIQPPPQFDAAAPGPGRVVAGEARVGEDLVALLDISRLTRLPAGTLPAEASAGHFCPEATPGERALFHARALALREAAGEEDGARLGLAVVGIGAEHFGVELAAVREFRDIARLSPIPCCPPHILGAISLRGEIVTLIDPRAALDLPPAPPGGKAVIGHLGAQALGIAVDEVGDVIYLRREAQQPAPALLRERHGAVIAGTVPYAGRMMAVLDLPALLARQEWIVDEHV